MSLVCSREELFMLHLPILHISEIIKKQFDASLYIRVPITALHI